MIFLSVGRAATCHIFLKLQINTSIHHGLVTDATSYWKSCSSLVQAMVSHLFGGKPIPKPMLTNCPFEQT